MCFFALARPALRIFTFAPPRGFLPLPRPAPQEKRPHIPDMYVVQTGTTHWHCNCRHKFIFASDMQVSRVQKHTSSAAVVCAGFDDIVQSESSQMAALVETVCFGWQSQNCTIKSTNNIQRKEIRKLPQGLGFRV